MEYVSWIKIADGIFFSADYFSKAENIFIYGVDLFSYSQSPYKDKLFSGVFWSKITQSAGGV